MLQRLFGIRAIAMVGMLMLVLLALGLAWYSTATYQRFAFEHQLQFKRDIVSIKTHQIINELNQRSKRFAYQLQSEPSFRQALARQDADAAINELKQGFRRAYYTSGLIDFKAILIRDLQGGVFAAAHEQEGDSYKGCPVLVDHMRTVSGVERLKPRYALCSFEGELYSEALIAIGALKPKGYLHIIAYSRHPLQQLEQEVHAPIKLVNAQAKILFQSAGWRDPDNSEDSNIKTVSYTLFGDDHAPGLVISTSSDFSDFSRLLMDTSGHFLVVAVIAAVGVFFLVVLLLGLAFRPLDTIRNSVGALLNGHYTTINVDKLPVELVDLAQCYNQLVYGMEEASERQQKAEKELISERDFISTTLNSIANAVVVVDAAMQVKLVNPAAELLLGGSQQNLQDYPLDELLVLYINRSATRIANLKSLLKTPHQLVNLFLQLEDQIIELEMMASPMVDKESDDVGHVLIFKDVTEDRKLRRKLNYEGRHDKLTGFFNRSAFEVKFDAMVAESDYTINQHIMVYLNLDQFKLVNDTCGNAAGDRLLKQVAETIRNNLRKSDLIARLGGDEFAMLLPYAETETAANTVNDILAYINQTGFNWEDREFTISASAALIPFGLVSDNYSEKLAKLTTARGIAKDNGGNQYYQIDDDDEQVQEHHSTMGWASGINKGFSEDRFKLYAQPIVPLKQKEKKSHYEILIRYQDEDDTIIRPGEFLLPAERFNLIEKIDRWVVSEVIHWLAANPQHENNIQFSINLSGRSIGSTSFHHYLVQLLESEAVDATALCFEITETAAVKDVEKSIEFIRVIKGLGAKFSLDDFGSGLSSFTYLKQFPVDYLKIDGVFIKDILHDAQSYDFVRSITEVGHCLGMKVIAEFVESKNMFHTLREAKVDYLQGYTIGRPAPIDELNPVDSEND